jgi:[ribosomal protein S18]-alanine N-acetyltransferase
MGIRVERAGTADAAELAVLEKQLFPEDAWSRALFDQELAHPDSYYLVTRSAEGQHIVGYGGLRAPVTGGQGDIQTLAVVPVERGKGLGRKLLEALLAEARAREVAEVFLEVRADNPVAISLYRRHGFDEIARRPGYYQPGNIDALVMRKELTPMDKERP